MDHIIRHLFIINPKSFWNKSKQNHVVAKIHQFFKLMEDSTAYDALFDPDTIELMLNPDGKIWQERLGLGPKEPFSESTRSAATVFYLTA